VTKINCVIDIMDIHTSCLLSSVCTLSCITGLNVFYFRYLQYYMLLYHENKIIIYIIGTFTL